MRQRAQHNPPTPQGAVANPPATPAPANPPAAVPVAAPMAAPAPAPAEPRGPHAPPARGNDEEVVAQIVRDFRGGDPGWTPWPDRVNWRRVIKIVLGVIIAVILIAAFAGKRGAVAAFALAHWQSGSAVAMGIAAVAIFIVPLFFKGGRKFVGGTLKGAWHYRGVVWPLNWGRKMGVRTALAAVIVTALLPFLFPAWGADLWTRNFPYLVGIWTAAGLMGTLLGENDAWARRTFQILNTAITMYIIAAVLANVFPVPVPQEIEYKILGPERAEELAQAGMFAKEPATRLAANWRYVNGYWRATLAGQPFVPPVAAGSTDTYDHIKEEVAAKERGDEQLSEHNARVEGANAFLQNATHASKLTPAELVAATVRYGRSFPATLEVRKTFGEVTAHGFNVADLAQQLGRPVLALYFNDDQDLQNGKPIKAAALQFPAGWVDVQRIPASALPADIVPSVAPKPAVKPAPPSPPVLAPAPAPKVTRPAARAATAPAHVSPAPPKAKAGLTLPPSAIKRWVTVPAGSETLPVPALTFILRNNARPVEIRLDGQLVGTVKPVPAGSEVPVRLKRGGVLNLTSAGSYEFRRE